MRITVNGFAVEVPSGSSARTAAQAAGFSILQFCNPKNKKSKRGQCGICLVRHNGKETLACHTTLHEGDTLETCNLETLRTRAVTAAALSREHFGTNGNRCVGPDGMVCPGLTKVPGRRCEFLTVALLARAPQPLRAPKGGSPVLLTEKCCTACGRCVDVCEPGAITQSYRTGKTPQPLLDRDVCISCGQCVKVCPTGTLVKADRFGELVTLVTDSTLARWYQYAPAILPALAVHFGLKPAEATHELMYALLARMGSYRTISTLVGADIITVVEATELLERMAANRHVPLVTSCCPGHMNLWQREIQRVLEETGVDIAAHMSSCHSPQEAVGGLMRLFQRAPEHADMRHVNISVMPCTAKQGEADSYGNHNVDYVITTRELLELIEYLGIDVLELVQQQARGMLPPLTSYPIAIPNTGGAALFAQTGGVTLAVLRYLGHTVLGRALGPGDERTIERTELASGGTLLTLRLGDVCVKALVVRGADEARRAYAMIADGSANALGIQVIEVMACPQGCITGGEQPADTNFDIVHKLLTLKMQDRAADDFDPAAFGPIQELLRSLGEDGCTSLFHRH